MSPQTDWIQYATDRRTKLLSCGDPANPAWKALRGWGYALDKAAGLGYDAPDATVVSTDTTKMSATFVVSTTRRDRHGDQMVQKGCLHTIDNYRVNPRVFFAHQSHWLPIGSARDPQTKQLLLSVDEDRISSTCYFHGKTPESTQIFSLVADGELQCASIGFLPLLGRLIDPQGHKKLEKDQASFDFGGIQFDQWDLLEWSVVAVPANPDAITCHLSKGLIAGDKISPALHSILSPFATPTKESVVSGFTPPLEAPVVVETIPVVETEVAVVEAEVVVTPKKEEDVVVETPTVVTVEEVKAGVVTIEELRQASVKVPKLPLGARLLKHYILRLDRLSLSFGDNTKHLENELVNKHLAEIQADLQTKLTTLKTLGHHLYPDHFEKQATTFVVTPPPAPEPEVKAAPPSIDWSSVEAALTKLQANQTSLGDTLYRLTGKSI